MKTDEQIQQDVMDELRWQPYLKASEIGVAVKDGIVTLSGTVNSYAKKVAAERVTKDIKGVRAVAEDIVVRVTPDSLKSDTDLAAAILRALKWHSDIQEENLKIKVEEGCVTLEGRVQWLYEKEMVHDAIQNIPGINGIINNIIVVPELPTGDIRQHIIDALLRQSTVDPHRIKVEVDGGKVTLSGKVLSFSERKIAEDIAWRTAGVKSVTNNIEIKAFEYAM